MSTTDQESIEVLNSLVPPKKCPMSNGHEETKEAKEEKPAASESEAAAAAAAPIPSGCPFISGASMPVRHKSGTKTGNRMFVEWQTSISIASEPIVYHDYLGLDKILNAQFPVSKKYGAMAHDEHLFIVVHQAYELWFKQIIFELDSIRELLGKPVVDERCLLVIVQRVQRINQIWKLLNDQIALLETMAPTDFLDFRGYLSTASGFQSLQFRIFENKFGLSPTNRIKFNQKNYDYVFNDHESQDSLRTSEEEPSLLKLIEAWLERTPGLVTFDYNEHGSKIEYNYLLQEYEKSVSQYLKDSYLTPADEEENEVNRKSLMDEYKKTVESFATIFDEERHNKLIERGERKISHKALWGALMIWLNRDEPRFHLPYQLLSLLTDMDNLVNRWRYNHALLAQRQVGNKSGTGGSSGYSYLRSTAGDRYKLFNDIVNLSTWLIPREYVPKLTEDIRKRLNTFD